MPKKIKYSIELLRKVEVIRSTLIAYNELDSFLMRLDEHFSGAKPDDSISKHPMYTEFSFLVSDPGKIPAEIEKNQSDYQNLIEEMILPNLFDDGDFINVVKSKDSSAKDATTMNTDIKAILKLFIDPVTKKNYLKEYATSKPDANKMKLVMDSLIESDMDTLETRTLTKSSLEFLCWKRSLEDLLAKLPKEESSSIQKDIDILDKPNVTATQFVDIFSKYHYKNVINVGGQDDTFPFSVTGTGDNESLKFQQKGAGSPDVCLMYKTSNGELFAAHAEPSNTPLSDVNRFENNSLIRHRADIFEDVQDAGLELKDDNMLSQHIFLIDSAMSAIDKDMGFTKSEDDRKKSGTIRTILTVGLEFLAKMRNFASTAESMKDNKENVNRLVNNRNILVSGLDSSGDNLETLMDLIKVENIESTIELVKQAAQNTKALDRKVVIASTITAIIHILRDEMGMDNQKAYDYIKGLVGEKTIDQYASGIYDGMFHGIELDKETIKTKEETQRADENRAEADELKMKNDALEWGLETRQYLLMEDIPKLIEAYKTAKSEEAQEVLENMQAIYKPNTSKGDLLTSLRGKYNTDTVNKSVKLSDTEELAEYVISMKFAEDMEIKTVQQILKSNPLSNVFSQEETKIILSTIGERSKNKDNVKAGGHEPINFTPS